jgi:serpin B
MKNVSALFYLMPLFVLLMCGNRIGKSDEKVTNLDSVPFLIVDGKVDPAMIKGNNNFAVELYREIRSEEGNTFFSPFSISAAMAMTYAGARTESEKQIAAVMHFNSDQKKFHTDYNILLNYVTSLNRKDSVVLSVANNMFAQKDYYFSEEYFKQIKSYYGADLQNLDFKNDLENSRKTINKWVEDRTKNKIQELLIPGVLSDQTRLVLVNAIYYLGNWETAFDPARTSKLSFYTNPESPVQAEFMYREAEMRFAELDNMKLVELPYAGGDLSLMVILPDDAAAMASIEKSLSADQWSLWSNLMTNKKIKLLLPKFKTVCEFELSEVLKKMGMPHPFSLQADLSGMTGRKDLMIDKVVHKAFIEVMETGTEAAAATAVVIREKNGMVIPEFRANKPFIFIIKDNKEGGILFMGRINDPTK